MRQEGCEGWSPRARKQALVESFVLESRSLLYRRLWMYFTRIPLLFLLPETPGHFSNYSRLPFKCFYKFIAPVVSAIDRQILTVTPWICPFLQIWEWLFPLQTQFFHRFKKSYSFSVSSAFSCCKDGVKSSKLFACRG